MNAETDFEIVAILLQPGTTASAEPFETISITLDDPIGSETAPIMATAGAQPTGIAPETSRGPHLRMEDSTTGRVDATADATTGDDALEEYTVEENIIEENAADKYTVEDTVEDTVEEGVKENALDENALDENALDEDTADEDTADEDTAEEDTAEEDVQRADVTHTSAADNNVHQICTRLHDAASGLATNPMLAFVAADSTLRTTSGVRRVVANLSESFGDPVLLIDCSESGLLEKTCGGTTDNGSIRSIQSGSEQVQVAETRYPGLSVWRAGDLQTSANVMEVATFVDKLLHEFKLVVLFTDISSSHGARQLIRMSRGCVVFFSTSGTRIAAAKRLRRHLKSWGASLYGSVLIENEAA